MGIKVIGIGPAGSKWLTAQAKEAIQWSDVVIGSERQLESISDLLDASQKTYAYTSVHKDLTQFIDERLKETQTLAVIASGDPSLYGIGKFLIQRYGRNETIIIPGISSLQYLFAAAQEDMNDVYLTSCHGRTVNFDLVFQMAKTGLLTDQAMGPYQIAQEALSRGLNPRVVIGEHLGYENETITLTEATQVEDRPYGMNAVIVINERVEEVKGR